MPRLSVGQGPRQLKDQRYANAYVFGAICPARDTGTALTALDRRAFMAATAASIAAPTALGAKECPTAGMDWITMSLETRNLAYNNVEHVGPENARKKTEGWAAAAE